VITWIQNFGYTDDGYYRCEKWGGAAVGFFYALSTPEQNYMKVDGPFCSAEKRNRELENSIKEHDSTAYNGA
jgi:hypothetical protein|tara:strand:- start:1581 stop:1796 length:216 start_codon:yes stop_codon:yes gene_type:complete